MTTVENAAVSGGRSAAFEIAQPDGNALTLLLSDAAASPDLWQEFLDGAYRRYRLHGFEGLVSASDEAIARGIERFSVIQQAGEVIAGLRIRGPLTAADLPICREFDGFPASEIIHAKIRPRLGEGLLEGKTAWVAKDFAGDTAALTDLLVAGAYLHMPLTDCRWIVGTVSPFSVPMFTRNRGVLEDEIEPVPVPSPKLLTGAVWFDRATLEDRIAAYKEHAI